MRFVGVPIYVEVGDQTPRVSESKLGFLDVHQGPELCQPEHLPGATVVIGRPSLVEYVREAEIAVGGGGRWQALPGFQLIARPRKRYHPGDLLMLGKTGGGRRSVRTARKDDLVPS